MRKRAAAAKLCRMFLPQLFDVLLLLLQPLFALGLSLGLAYHSLFQCFGATSSHPMAALERPHTEVASLDSTKLWRWELALEVDWLFEVEFLTPSKPELSVLSWAFHAYSDL